MAYVQYSTASFGSDTPSLLVRAFAALRGWWLVHRTERELAELSDRQLADIGLDAPRLPRAYRDAMLTGQLLR